MNNDQENTNTASQAQIEANRVNGQLGGVKTDEGKENIKYNAVKHGILVQHMSDGEREAVKSMQESLVNDFRPDTTIEYILIERIAIWYVRLQRVIKAETEQLKKIDNPRVERVEGGINAYNEVLTGKTIVENEGYQPKITEQSIDLFEKTYTRYETTVERNFYKALHELQRIQAGKRGENVPPPIAVDVSVEQAENSQFT